MEKNTAAIDFREKMKGKTFHTILADPPWQFKNRTSKASPEYKKRYHYPTLSLAEIKGIPVQETILKPAHLYLWVPNALIGEGLDVMKSWGFTYKTTIVWRKIRKDGATDNGGLGFYFRNATELVLFGVTGHPAQTLEPGRRQVNLVCARRRGHSTKPDELYTLIEQCSRGGYLEMFARRRRSKWEQWGNQIKKY